MPALLRILPLVVAAALASPVVGGLVSHKGPRAVILGGLALIVLGAAALGFLQATTPYAFVVIALVLIGVGNIAVVTPVTGMSYEAIRDVTRAWRQAVGQSASTGARVLPEGMEHLFEGAFRDAFTVGVARVFLVAAGVALVCMVLAWFGLPRSGGKQGAA